MSHISNMRRLMLGALLSSTMLTGCVEDSSHTPTVTTTIPPLSTVSPGTVLQAPVSTGFTSATVASGVLTLDNPTTGATVTEYTNGNIGITAPNLPTNGKTDTATFAQFFIFGFPIAPPGSLVGSVSTANNAYATLYNLGPSMGLQYSDYGLWTAAASSASATTEIGAYAVGNGTLPTLIPKSGSATYTGNAEGSYSNSFSNGQFGGLVSLSANFAANTLTGSITDIRIQSNSTGYITGSMNDIELVGSITNANFSGTTSVSAVSGTGATTTGATGTFGGGFYGTNPTEAVGIFGLSGGTFGTKIVGAFGATLSFSSAAVTPSVDTLAGLPDGTPLLMSTTNGFVTATNTNVTVTNASHVVTSTTNTIAIDTTNTTGASFVFYSNGNIDLTAPNIPDVQTPPSSATIQTVSFPASSYYLATNALAPNPVTTTANSLLPVGTLESHAFSANVGGTPNLVTLYRMAGSVGLQYSDFGEWTTTAVVNPALTTVASGVTTTTSLSSYGFYGVGSATPTSQMPTTGTAIYTGTAYGVVQGTPATGQTAFVSPFSGALLLTADFAALTLDGGISGIRTLSPTSGLPTSTSSVTGITLAGSISGNTFTGTAAPSTSGVVVTGGTGGTFSGGFYGPSAKEIAGTFKVTGTGTTGGTLLGAFGAHR